MNIGYLTQKNKNILKTNINRHNSYNQVALS
jgi:hypothetical protein